MYYKYIKYISNIQRNTRFSYFTVIYIKNLEQWNKIHTFARIKNNINKRP